MIHVFSKPMHMMSHAETAKLIAACGYGGIDYTVRKAQGHVLPEKVEEDLPRAIEAAHAVGLKVEMITTEITSVRTPHAENVIRTAAKLGVKYYRLGSFNYDLKLGVAGTLEKIKPDFAELAALNASAGIHGAIQNHAGARVGSAIWDLYELLRGLEPRAIGVQYDIRHATVEGGQSWPLPLKLLAPWIRCTDIKDFKWIQSPGKSVIDNVPLGALGELDRYRTAYDQKPDYLNLFPMVYWHTTSLELRCAIGGGFDHPLQKLRQLLVFYDACFSGGVAGLPSRTRGLQGGDVEDTHAACFPNIIRSSRRMPGTR